MGHDKVLQNDQQPVADNNKRDVQGKEHHKEQPPGTGYYKGKDASSEHLKEDRHPK